MSSRDLAPITRSPTADDRDGDGLLDADEQRLAAAYLPFLSIAPDDACPTSGLVVRVTPAERPGQVRLRYAWLFDRACLDATRAGDGGGFGMVIDPTRAGAEGIIALRAVGRQETSCQRVSSCGRCDGQPSCSVLAGRPAVWAGRDRHTTYVNRSTNCTQLGACRVECIDAATSAQPPLLNVGEPGAPLVHDLTNEGFVRPELGWQSAELLHHDPWSGLPFGASTSIELRLASGFLDPMSCALP